MSKSAAWTRAKIARKETREAARLVAAKSLHPFIPSASGDGTFHGCGKCGFGRDVFPHVVVKAVSDGTKAVSRTERLVGASA